MKFAICNETYQGWSWADTCRHIAATGYEGVEIAPFTLAEDVHLLSSSDRTEIRDVARSEGLEIVGLHWLLVRPPGLSVTSGDAAVRLATQAYLVALVELCAGLGGTIMVLGSPAQRRIGAPDRWETAVGRLQDALLPALDAAEQAGITLCLEPLPAPEADFVLTLSEAQTIVRRIGHPALKSILDIKSACSEARPIPDLVRGYADIIAHVHANDSNRRGPGFGDVDFRPIVGALAAARYTGWISVEVFDYTPDPETIARESLRYLKSVVPSDAATVTGPP